MGLYSGDLDRIGIASFDGWRASRLVVDTGMHALDWSRDRAIAFMHEHTALAPDNIANEVDRYITWPGQALAYKLGQLEILRLRAGATERLGARFDIRAFHDRVDANWLHIGRAATQHVDRADRNLRTAGTGAVRAGQAVVLGADRRLGEATRRLARAAPRTVERATLDLEAAATRVGSLDPARALARGWSITRTAQGSLVRSVEDLQPDDLLVTTFADGTSESRIVPDGLSRRAEPTPSLRSEGRVDDR